MHGSRSINRVYRMAQATLASLLMLVVLLSPVGAQASMTSDPRPDVIVVGDSVSNAMGVASPLIDAWPRRLERLGGVSVVNRSVGGDTTEKAVARFDSDVVSAAPKAVIILVGLNDLRRSIPMETIRANYRWMAQRALAAGIKPYLGTITPLRSPWAPIKQIDDWMREYSAQTPGVGLIDFYRALEFPPGSGMTTFIVPVDYCHPNANGHWLMTLPALSSIIASGEPRPTSLTMMAAKKPGTAGYSLSGNLQADRVGLPGQRLILQVAYPGGGFSDVSDSVSYSSARTTEPGRYTLSIPLGREARYRLRYEGTDLFAATAPTAWAQIGRAASLTTPTAPAVLSPGKAVTVSGFLRPRHASGTHPVEIRVYKYEDGSWRPRGFVQAVASGYSDYTKYSCRLTLPTMGRWRLRAYAPADADHFSRWSAGFRYVTVR